MVAAAAAATILLPGRVALVTVAFDCNLYIGMVEIVCN